MIPYPRKSLAALLLSIGCILMLRSEHGKCQQEGPRAVSGAHMCSLKKSGGVGLPVIGDLAGGPTHSFDVLNYTLSLDIYTCFLSPFPHTYAASETVTFRAVTAIDTITLNAVNSSLTIDSVGMAGVSFTHASDILTIVLNRSYAAGETGSVAIHYRHAEVVDDAFYVSNGMVFTDCEPQGARKWFPCWDAPSDKATIDLTARVPSTARLGSNGRLADSVVAGDTSIYHWVSRDPVATYLVVMTGKVGYNMDMVTWHRLSDSTQIVPIRFYWNAGENTTNLFNMESIIIPMITRYSQLFGEHPFEKNGFATIAQGAGFNWGGMENQTLTSLCFNCWDESYVSHEFAHQWFGDMITCGTWADVWLNEGFATYCEALWNEYKGGPAWYKSTILSDANAYLSQNPGWPIYNPSWAVTPPSLDILFDEAITYEKGACVLHMLRYVLGDSLFFKAIKAYATDTLNFKYKSAVTADFLSAISNATGQDLSWFGEWLYLPNHPLYKNSYSISQLGPESWSVSVTTGQTQATGFFEMPLEFALSFSSGPDSVVRVMNTVNHETFVFTTDRQPVALAFDPDDGIVLKTASTVQTAVAEAALLPETFRLNPGYPNPFNPTTTVSYEVPVASLVTLEIFDELGRRVTTLEKVMRQPGSYHAIWDARQFASGVYFCRMSAAGGRSGHFEQTQPLMLVK